MKFKYYLIAFIAGLTTFFSCANQGSGPDGGPYDETPPRIVGMTAPEHAGTAGKRGTKISIRFSEAVQLDNAQEKVIVSPPQLNTPEIVAEGKRVNVHLLDTLRPETTYTIDFSDAIKDATEGNPLGRFTYLFSTGETIDTLQVSGTVLAAEDLEPVKGILVGLYPADAPDSVFHSQPLTRVARTDGEGHFCIKGVKEGEYRVVCLEDKDQNFTFSMKSEMIGWARETVKPYCKEILTNDTLWSADHTQYDSIRTIPSTRFLPDDVLVLAFKEAAQPRHLLKFNRDKPEKITFFFTAPSTTPPQVEGVGFDASLLMCEHNVGYDTVSYWICDTTLVQTDSLTLNLSYEETNDSTGLLEWHTDTAMVITPKVPLARRQKLQAEERAKWDKGLEKRHKRGDYSKEVPPPPFIKTEGRILTQLTPLDNITLTFSEPLKDINMKGVHLMLGPDSMQVEAPFELTQVEGRLRSYLLRAEWRPDQQYTFIIDSTALTNIYDYHNNRMKINAQVAKLEDFGTVFITIPDADTCAVVQLLDGSGKVTRQERVVPLSRHRDKGGRAEFYYVQPGTYYYRCFLDHNGDDKWTPGCYDEGRLSEEMFYSPVQLNVKANFDFDQTWSLYELPLTTQKPEQLIKQKVDKTQRPGGREKNEQRKQERH